MTILFDSVIRFKDSNEPEDMVCAIGEYIEGENDDEDEAVFFWFEPGETILGDHGDFILLSHEDIDGISEAKTYQEEGVA